MPSAEEDYDHDLSRYTRRCCGHHHRWILWTVNAAIGKIHTRRRGVRKREPSPAPVPRRIGRKRWTRRLFGVESALSRLQRQHHHHYHHRRRRRRRRWKQRRQPVVSISILYAASSTALSSTHATPRSTDRRRIPSFIACTAHPLSRLQENPEAESPVQGTRSTTAPATRATNSRGRRRCRCRCSLIEIATLFVSFRFVSFRSYSYPVSKPFTR